jgi:hypothetical protein
MSQPDIVFLVGHSGYDVLTYMTQELDRAVQALGYTTATVDLKAGRYDIPVPQRFFCAYSGIGAELMWEGQLLYDAVRVPYVGLQLDKPSYFPSRHLIESKYFLLFHFDLKYHEASVDISPPSAYRGLLELCYEVPQDLTSPLAERDIPVLFASKGGNPRSHRDSLSHLPHKIQSIIDDIVDACVWGPPLPIWDVAKERIQSEGLLSGFHKLEMFHVIVRESDHLIRLHRTTRVLESLLHLPIYVVGGQWDHIDKSNGAATFVPGVSLPELRWLMSKAQIVLNVQQNATHWVHDRLIYGLMHGAIAASDANSYIDQRIGRDKYLGFQCDDGGAADLMADALRDIAARQPIATRGQQFARESFDIRRMAAKLVAAIETYACLNA